MNNLRLFILLVIWVCSVSLHAQVTYLWTPINDGVGFGVDRYEMHEIDFLNGRSLRVAFSIDESRFEHPNMTGISFLINSFEFTPDMSQVYFMELEGDLYRYTIATDVLEYLGDMVPETKPAPLIFGYTQIGDISFINDSLIYCGGFTHGIYNTQQNSFQKLREPASHAIAGTKREQEIALTRIARHKGDYLYLPGPGSRTLRLADLSDPENNVELLNFDDFNLEVAHNQIISYQYACDSTTLFVGAVNRDTKRRGFWKVDIERNTVEYFRPWIDIPGGVRLRVVKHYNNPTWESCQRHIDLDADDSTIGGENFLIDRLCRVQNIPLSDLDVQIRNEHPIDSIDVAVINPQSSLSLHFPDGNYTLSSNTSSWQHLLNNGSTTISDFENAIRNAYLDIEGNPDISEIQIRFTVWFDGIEGKEAIATIRFAAPLPFSGDNIAQQWCEGDKNLTFTNILAPNAQEGGIFYDNNYLKLNAIPHYLAPISDTIYYVTTNGICYDTAQIITIVNPNPSINPIPDETLCYDEALEIDLTNHTHKIEWYDGSNDKVRSFDQSGTYSYLAQNTYGCTSSDTFTLTKLPTPLIEPMDVTVCVGEQFEFMQQVYTDAGNYQDTLLGSLGCDSIIYLIDFDFYDRIPIELTGELGFCEGESTQIQIISDHNPISIGGQAQNNPITIDQKGDFTLSGYDVNGCFEELDISVASYPTPIVFTSDLIDTIFTEGLTLPVSYQGQIESYSWSPSLGLNCVDCPFPYLMSPEEGVYTIEVENEYMCKATSSLTIRFKDSNYYLPNIISNHPNTPINGSFFLQSNSSQQYELYVFDRWGNILFQNKNATMNIEQDGWHPNGSVNSGTYVYMIKLSENKTTKILKGNITVVE